MTKLVGVDCREGRIIATCADFRPEELLEESAKAIVVEGDRSVVVSERLGNEQKAEIELLGDLKTVTVAFRQTDR